MRTRTTEVAKLVLLFSLTLALVSCGNGGDNKPATTGDSSAATAAPAAAPSADMPHKKGLELIAASDCITCHKIHLADAEGASTGPAYEQVAAKYSPAADTTIDRLVKKIISGGSGVWGTIPMIGHPALPQADVKEMVQYIMTLKK
ncbi:MAG TPA: c-type cytochrome [Puia sp.]|jgi:cytochrome c